MNKKLSLKSPNPNSESLVTRFLRGAVVIVAFGLCALVAACDGKDSSMDDVAWSLDGSAAVLVSPGNRSELLIGRWPQSDWQKLKIARPGFEFYHPLWLLDRNNLPLIAVFEICTGDKGSDSSDTLLRIFDPGTGSPLDQLSSEVTGRLHALDDLSYLTTGTGQRTLILAGKLQNRYVVRELDIATLATQQIVSSNSEDFEILVSRDGRYIATVESPVLSARDFQPVCRLAITPTQVVWRGPLAEWEFPLRDAGNSQAAGKVDLLSWSPDGTWLAAKTNQAIENLMLFRPHDSFARQLFRGKDIHEVTWSPDSRRLAFLACAAEQINNSRMLWIYDFTQSGVTPIAVAPEVKPLGWARQNHALLLLGSDRRQTELGFLEITSRRQSVALREEGEADLILSPDNRLGIWLSKNNSPAWIQF